MNQNLENLAVRVQGFGKENLSDILHYTAVGLKPLFGCHMVRIYLEDLHQGILICQYVTGQKRPDERQITQFISPRDSITSQAFYENKVILSWTLPEGFIKYRNPFEKISGIKASVVFPIVHEQRPIGTLTLDWQEDGKFVSTEQVEAVSRFLTDISAVVDRAKRFHQQISFSRHLDLARKKEAAWMIVRSAVKLIDKLSLASVLVPAFTKNAKPSSAKPTDLVEVMAVYSKKREDASTYMNKDQMSVLNDENLINRIVKYDKSRGLIIR
ncbi:MAG TPA: GAF domain-containing protein, partial [Nitrospinaceae bacterium]|nr:GAF domain-containing protein [Nitrospinaceae bacterium]